MVANGGNGAKIKVKFDEGCLKQEKITFHHENIVMCIFRSLSSLFGVAKSTKNADLDKYYYSG